MEKLTRVQVFLISCAVFCLIGWGMIALAAEATAAGNTVFSCVLPESEGEITLTIALPEGWKRNTGFGTVVFEPGNAGDYYEAPNVEIRLACEGECATAAIPANIDSYVQRLKDGWKTLSTGDETLDKLGTTVEVLKDEKKGNTRFFAASLTYPEGVSSSMYPPRLYLFNFIHNPGDPYFILVKGVIPESLKSEFHTTVEQTCESVGQK